MYELYVIFNKVNKVQAKNKVQKVRTSQLWAALFTDRRLRRFLTNPTSLNKVETN